VTNHVRLDFNLVESLAIIDTENGSNHLGNDDHVTEVGAHGLRLLTSSLSSLLGLTELLDETEALAVKSTLESAIRSMDGEDDENIDGITKSCIQNQDI